tara:strand:- start:270 stop:1577 length:1308 start_codon:yes stop_codon:yes gene_type:complete
MRRGAVASSVKSGLSGMAPQTVASSTGLVIDIIYDDTHPKIQEIAKEFQIEGVDTRRVDFLYYAKIRKDGDVTSTPTSGQWVPPHSYNDLELPVKNERVELLKLQGRECYKRIASFDLNLPNFDPNAILVNNPVIAGDDSNKSKKYKEVASTGTPTSNKASSEEERPKNSFIKPEQINPLKAFDGDKLIQSRFGQSIRFSGYYNGTEDFSPTIIIRNRQATPADLNEKTPTLEDFKDDGSIITLSSNEQKLPYSKDFLNSEVLAFGGGYTNGGEFEETTYPAELTGDNIFIKSSRITLASQEGEMIFLSKGNYGFISDGLFTIDNFNPSANEDEKGGGGALLNFGGDVIIKSNGDDIKLLGDESGLVYLNTLNQEEPIVKGNTLKTLLTELIDLINKQIFSTPSGPTALGPNNRTDFQNLSDRLENFLSEKNYTE